MTLTDVLRKELDDNVKGVTVPEKIQGLNQFYAYLEANPLITAYLFTRFRTMISSASASAS